MWKKVKYDKIIDYKLSLTYDDSYCEYFLNKLSQIKSSPPSAAYMHQWIGSALVQIMACHLFGAEPLSKPILGYFQLNP